MAKQQHLRPGSPAPADAERYHSVYGDYGRSVFAARVMRVDELAQKAARTVEVLTPVRVGGR